MQTETAQALCRALDDCDRGKLEAMVERFSASRAFAFVRAVRDPAEVAARVAALDLEGVGFMKESRRYYPKKELAAQLLGYVGIDNVGLGGIEAAYDSVVRGRDGKVLVQTDARRRGFSSVERTPTAGGALELTIDEQLQHIVERELRIGVSEHRADGGTAVVMDPHTGEILAMATYPTFNPNAFRTAPDHVRRNRAVTDLYEPGSTFKIVTASAAFEEGVVSPTDFIDVSPGFIKFGSRRDRRRPPLRRPVVRRRDREVEQRRRHQGRPQPRARAARPLREPLRLRQDRPRPTSRARAPASSGIRAA